MLNEKVTLETSKWKPMLSNNVYNVTKTFVQIVLPALATLYFTLASIWNLSHAEEVVGTIAALTTFLGVVLGFSSRAYNASESKYDGKIVVTTNEKGVTLYSLELNDDPSSLKEKKDVSFKIQPNTFVK